MVGGYEAFDDPYVYPGTSVLRNRLDIRNAELLESFEAEMFTLRASELLPEGNFNAAHFCAVHRHLFGDVYDWAGTYRTVRIAKGETMFCYPGEYSGPDGRAFCRDCGRGSIPGSDVGGICHSFGGIPGGAERDSSLS
jgi:cell filamentation protein